MSSHVRYDVVLALISHEFQNESSLYQSLFANSSLTQRIEPRLTGL